MLLHFPLQSQAQGVTGTSLHRSRVVATKFPSLTITVTNWFQTSSTNLSGNMNNDTLQMHTTHLCYTEAELNIRRLQQHWRMHQDIIVYTLGILVSWDNGVETTAGLCGRTGPVKYHLPSCRTVYIVIRATVY